MPTEDKYFETLSEKELWQRYCGFLDLSLTEFMDIQSRLLMNQIGLVANSPLGKKIMKNQKPTLVEEFRKLIPLTSYDDYAAEIGECDASQLAV